MDSGGLATSRRCEFPPRLVAGLAVMRNIRQFVSGTWRERMLKCYCHIEYCVIRPANTLNYIYVCYSYPEL